MRIRSTSSTPTAPNLFIGPFDPRTSNSPYAPGANYAALQAFTVSRPVTVSGASVVMGGTVGGNVDLGIYTGPANSWTRIASSGSQAVGPAYGTKTVTFTAPVTLVPGVRYWSAIATDSATCEFFAIAADAQVPGLVEVSGRASAAFPLPVSIGSAAPYSYSAVVTFA